MCEGIINTEYRYIVIREADDGSEPTWVVYKEYTVGLKYGTREYIDYFDTEEEAQMMADQWNEETEEEVAEERWVDNSYNTDDTDDTEEYT